MELVGGGGASNYTHLRYALTYQDSSVLNYQYTDSAAWISTKKHFGYGFHPRTGTGTMSNGNGGAGVLWTIKDGSWSSTWSNNGLPISAVKQAPRDAEMVAGIYNFAISVQPLPDGNNEVRWYMIEKDNKYWFGGTVIDTAAVTTKFNGVCFGFNKDTEATQVNFYAVEVDMGEPITVPEAPWEPFYVNQWGKSPAQGTAWPVKNDSTYLDGDATLGDGAIPTGWATIRGGFGDPVQATLAKAVIVRGQMELVGGGGASNYTHLRYALTYQDSSVLNNQYTDSATWVSTKKHFGYGFHPRTGTGTMSNGNGGAGVVWTIKDGSWSSTWSNNGLPISAVQQAPRNAVMEAGIYNFAISVQPLPDGNNEVRWYMIEKDNKYWYGGTVIDTAAVTTKFNGVCFGFNKDTEATQVNFYAVEVDMGEPIDVPVAPWEAYYVDNWGFYGGRIGDWKFTRGEFDGDATVSGAAPNTGWAALRGGFDTIAPTAEKALSVTGKLELVGGGFEAVRSLRFALAYSDSAGKVDTTSVDSTKWTGTDAHDLAYLFLPTSGANGPVDWQGIGAQGTLGAVVDNPWLSTSGANNYVLGSVLQRPDQAVAGPGTYEFGISVQPLGNGTSEIRVKLLKTDGTYAWAVKTIDMHSPLVTEKFNSILFALNTNASTTAMNLIEVLVDMGAPIELPDWVVSVESLPVASLPTVYALGQNYPNPFNPTTTMEISLPKRSQVSLVVYDALGKVVAELMNGTYSAGVHKVNFNAINLSSGIYFYKLTAGEFSSTRKLMLLK